MANLATWFTLSLQTISRSAGRSSVIAAAYRACTKLTDERLGITRDFTPKGKHGLAGNICIGVPNDDIEKLWNDAEKSETRANSTVARELMIPLASEWNDHERRECVRAIAQMLRDEYGVAVLASIHRPARDNNNDHAHLLFTTRTVDACGVFGKKTRILDDAKTGEVKKMRERVCAIVNEHAIVNGSDWYVYAGKFSEIIADHIPTTHISIAHGKNQKQLIDANKENVKEAQAVVAKTKSQIAINDAKITELFAEIEVAESSNNGPTTSGILVQNTTAPNTGQALLSRRMMPDDAAKAHADIEGAWKGYNELQKNAEKWTAWKSELERNRPNFVVRAFGSYNGKMASANRQIRLLEGALQEHAAIVQDPKRKRLKTVYDCVIAHNVKVREQELHLAKVDADRVVRLAEENSRQHQLMREQEASSVDWSARLNESSREMETRRERDSATEYSSGGMGM